MAQIPASERIAGHSARPDAGMGENERLLSAFAGSLLLYATAKKNPINSLLLLGGGYLLYRAISGHCPIKSVLSGVRHSDRPSEISVRTNLVVSRPRNEVYAFWRQLENLPLFMKHIENIDELDADTSAWKLKLPGGAGDIRWEAKIVKEEEGKELSWHSVPGAAIENTGKINFSDTPGNATRIDVMISYRAPMGVIGERVGRLLSPVFTEKIESDLNNFKHYIENASLAGD